MARKSCSYCCSTFFPCFPCFSARNNTPSSSALPNPSDADAISSSENVNTKADSSIVATESAVKRQDTQALQASPQVSTFQVASSSAEGASTDAPSSLYANFAFPAVTNQKALLTSDDPKTPTNHPDAASFSSAENVSCTVVPAVRKLDDLKSPSEGSSSSTTVQTMSNAIDNIGKDVTAAAGENAKIDLGALIKHISELLKLAEEEGGKKSSVPRMVQRYLPTSQSWIKLKEFLSEATNFLKDIIPGDAKNIVHGLLQNMGTAHLATTGFLVVANMLERFEDVSNNREECLRLMKEMSFLAKLVMQFEERSQLKEGMHDEIEAAIGLIVESSIMCCSQMGSSAFYSFFSTSVDKGKLAEFTQKLDDMNKHIYIQMGICIYDVSERKKAPLSKLYPEHAVGIEESVKEVIDLLEWGSEQNALTVVVHGFGGMGKTTLADAVISLVNVEGCKYSEVQLFKDIKSSPDILELQKMMLKDLMESEVPDIRKHEDGQRELGYILEKVQAFIYIDNVLSENELRKLLPKDMNKAKKVRLLLTARNENVGRVCPMETPPKIYHMKGISTLEATSLLKKDIKEEMDSSQFNEIVEICGGIPLMLTLVGPFIGHAMNKQEAHCKLMQNKGRWEIEPFDEIERYVFAYDDLPNMCKDAFLDICLFFKGWDWETVADIVGGIYLEMLESRALVTKGTNGVTSLHDVILTLGCQKTERITRFKFTSARGMKECLDRMKEKDIQNIKGIWLSDNKDLFLIPATKLDSMYESLRILKLGNFAKVEGKCNEIFKNLIFFQGAVSDLPFDVTDLELKYLSYQPRDLKLFEMPPSLRYMEFDGRLNSHAFEISATDLKQLKNLRILKLTRFVKLKKLTEQLGDLVNGLQELTLSYCISIEDLPPSISKLKVLRVLRMEGCSSLRKLPVNFGSLNSLQELNLQGCKNLVSLPGSIETLSSLKLLDLSSCPHLLELPDGIGNLTSLVNLSLNKCECLTSIPESIGMLKLLPFAMDMSLCLSLKRLPDLFVELGYLRELDLSNCWNIEMLPKGFGQLKYLVKLNLTDCRGLRELCNDFHCLSSLRVLYLSQCGKLRELPRDFHCLSSLQSLYLSWCWSLEGLSEDFHCLPSLQHLYLCDCSKLEGKWMENLVNVKTLQIMDIQGSSMLVKRWGDIKKGSNQPSFAVYTGQDFSREEKDKILQKLLSELDCLLIDKRGNPFHISNLPLNTLSLVMFHMDPDADFPCPLIEEALEDIQINQNFEMIYVGKHFIKLPGRVKDKILGYSPNISDLGSTVVKLLLTLDEAARKSWLSTLDKDVEISLISRLDYDKNLWLERYSAEEPIYFLMEMVEASKGDKCSPCWKVLSNHEIEDFVLRKCERYVKLKELVETPRESNIELLTELFAAREEENIFQRNSAYASNKLKPFTCGLTKLKGKTILLEMRDAVLCEDIRLGSLIEMYRTEREKLDLEIISIPIVQPSTKSDVLDAMEQFTKNVPWLVLQNPFTISRAVKYFLVTQQLETDDKQYPSLIWIIEGNGRISSCKPFLFFSMLYRQGPKTYSFTQQKIEELRKHEWNGLKSMSSLKFLFNHLESVPDQVKETMFQGKMICLYNGNKEVTSSLWNAMMEFKDDIHIIYIPRYYRYVEMLRLTDTIYKSYYLLEEAEMPQAAEMEGMSLLNLSKHDAMRFWMRLLHLKEDISGMNGDGDKQLTEMRRLLDSLQLIDDGDDRYKYMFEFSEDGYKDRCRCCMALMDEDGKMVAACSRETMEWIFRDDRKDRAKQLIKQTVKVIKEEKIKTVDSASIPNLTKKLQTIDQEDVDIDLDSLSNYTYELLEMEQLFQLLIVNQEGKILSRPKAGAGQYWPTSMAFSMFKNYLTEGESAFKDIASSQGEEDDEEWMDNCIKSLLKEIGKENWGAMGLLTVAEVLERFDTVSVTRNEWLFCLDAMYRLALYLKQCNESPELLKRMESQMEKSIELILLCSFTCRFQIDPSKFPRFLKHIIEDGGDINRFDELGILGVQQEVEEMCNSMAKSISGSSEYESEEMMEVMGVNQLVL